MNNIFSLSMQSFQKLHQSSEQDLANNYFKNKRADKLLRGSQDDKNRSRYITQVLAKDLLCFKRVEEKSPHVVEVYSYGVI